MVGCRDVFHWKYSGWFIALFWGAGLAMIGIGQAGPDWWFILAYVSFGAASIWTLGYLLTSDWLRKLNPSKWGKARRKRYGKRDWIVFRLASVGLPTVFTCLLALAVYGTYSVQLYKELSSLHGWLSPANDPTPLEPCGPVPQGSMVLYLGGIASVAKTFPHTVLEINGRSRLILNRDKSGNMAVSVDIFSPEDGRLIATIENNVFTVNQNNYLRMERSDKSSLVVYDQYKKEALNTRYLNPSAFKLTAQLFYQDYGRVDIRGMSNICIEGASRADYSFDSR